MMKVRLIFLSLFLITIISCEKAFMKPKAAQEQTVVFDEYVKLVKEKYGMLEFKAVDIDQLSDSLRPYVFDEMTDDSLFSVLSIIVSKLKDGHSILFDERNIAYFAGYNFIAGYPLSFNADIWFNNYVNPITAPQIEMLGRLDGGDLRAVYGRLPQDAEIGYLYIPTFNVTISEAELELIFSSFKTAKGVIVDVRGNTGGDPILATNIAAYFTEEEVYTGYENFKVGPGENDFSQSPSNLKPADSENRFLKPVAVLTDRFVYSAATTFCYSLNPLENVTFIGQRTGGGSGSVAAGYLTNGWIWNLSVSEFIGVDDNGNEQHLDNGFEPDISVSLDTLVATKDELIERAILELQ